MGQYELDGKPPPKERKAMSLMSLSEETENTHSYSAEKHNPLKHPFVVTEVESLLSLSDEFPGYITRESLEDTITGYLEQSYELLLSKSPTLEQQRIWSRNLRSRILLSVGEACRYCQKCDLYKNTPANIPSDLQIPGTPVFGEGAIDALVMIVAEGPGQFEARTGLPMVGNVELRASTCASSCLNFEPCFVQSNKFVHHAARPCQFQEMTTQEWEDKVPQRLRRKNNLNTAGEILNECMGDAGLVRSAPHMLAKLQKKWLKTNLPDLILPNVYVTNAVRHHPVSESEQNRTPTAKEIQACSAYLELTIRIVQPKVIVALGSVGLQALRPLKVTSGILRLCPESLKQEPIVIETKMHPRVFPCVHPAYIMHQLKENPNTKYAEKITQVLTRAREKAEELLSGK